MRILQPYKQLNKLIEKEIFEPDISWGLRMAIATMVPLLYGIKTGRLAEAGWVALMAECICWVELKGDFLHRLKLLAGSSFLAIVFALLGSVTGNSIWLSVVAMAIVAFISSLLKNIGNRGNGLAICVYALFIFSNAYPTGSFVEFEERALLVVIGVGWNIIAALIASVFVPAQRPYRRSIAVIWKAIAELVATASKGWEDNGPRSKEHDIYLKEKAIREAINASLELYDKLAHEATEKDGPDYHLAQARKAAAIIGTQVLTIADNLNTIHRHSLDTDTRVRIFSLLRALEQTFERLSIYTVTSEKAEEILLMSRVNRLYKLSEMLKDFAVSEQKYQTQVTRLVQLTERIIKIIESAFQNLQVVANDRSMVRSYSLMKTIYILHPKYWLSYVEILLNFSTFTARYALRSAIAAAIAVFIYKYWNIDHGYWIPFTLIIVMQTYFGATWQKARDRVVGTVAGGLVAGLFLKLPTGLYLQEILLFLTFIPMTVYLRKRYSVAAFFITINLVLLFNINKELNDTIIITRALSTIAGSAIAIIAGFALLPTWDKKLLPAHLADAVYSNYSYFFNVVFAENSDGNWAKYKRKAESANSNAFDSFSRYMEEPAFKKKPFAVFYFIITHNIRVTRELNNMHMEEKSLAQGSETQHKLITECFNWFNKNISLLKQLNPDKEFPVVFQDEKTTGKVFNQHQEVYLTKMLVELKAMNNDLQILVEKLPRIMQL